MTTKQQKDRIRRNAINGERKEQRRKKLLYKATQHDPHWFGLDMLTAITSLATGIRRLKRDKAAGYLTPEHREAIAAASIKLAPLLASLPDLMRHPAADTPALPALPAPEVQP